MKHILRTTILLINIVIFIPVVAGESERILIGDVIEASKDVTLDNSETFVNTQTTFEISHVQKVIQKVIEVYNVKEDMLLENVLVQSTQQCLSLQDIYRGYSILNFYYYFANEKYFNNPYTATLSKPIVSLIKKAFQKSLNVITENDLKYIIAFLEQLDIYYDLFNRFSSPKNIEILNNEEDLTSEDFHILGFPKSKNICFLQFVSIKDISIRMREPFHIDYRIDSLSLESYFFSFWLRRYNAGNTKAVKEILDFVLPLAKSQYWKNEVSHNLIFVQRLIEAYKSKDIDLEKIILEVTQINSNQNQQLIIAIINSYKAKNVQLDNLTIGTIDQDIGTIDQETQEIFMGYSILISYYYLARLQYLNESIGSMYDTYWSNSRKSVSLADILSEQFVSMLTKAFQQNINIITKHDLEYILSFLEELEVYYYVFNTYANKKNIQILNNQGHLYVQDFHNVGFPKSKNTYFIETWIQLRNINIRNQESDYSISSLSLEGYFLSFWLRRYNERNMELVKEILDFVLPRIEDRYFEVL